MTKNWAVWLRAMTVTAAVMAILVSALAISPEVDHHALPTQSTVASAAEPGVIDDGSTQAAPATNCHSENSCIFAIIPRYPMGLTRFDAAPELLRVTGYRPSGAAYLLFHPPRVLSQG
jgi:hypothetical protein